MGGRPLETKLSDKHLKALALLEAGELSNRQIAKEVGWSEQYFYDIYQGNTEKTSQVTNLFQLELKKIEKKRVAEIRTLTISNKKMALRVINDFLVAMNDKKRRTEEDVKMTTAVMNCLNKASPSVEINNTSYSYTRGMTPEELIHEFTRLKSLATAASVGRGVQESGSGRPGVVPGPTEPGG